MKLGIGLIFIGTIFLWDGVINLLLVGDLYADAVVTAGGFIKLLISAVLLFFGTRRVYRKRQKEG